MAEMFNELMLAAWLHPVGTFAQRASCDDLCVVEKDNAVRKTMDASCSSAAYTKGFLRAFKDSIPKSIDLSKLIQLAAPCSNPAAFEEWITIQSRRLTGISSDSEKTHA